MVLPGHGISWKAFLVDVKREFVHDQLDDVAGMLTFSGMLALFPFLLFALSLASHLVDANMVASLLESFHRLLPAAAAEILGDQVRALVASKSSGVLTLGALGAIWAGSSGVAALVRALNTAYGVREHRSWVRVRLLAVASTLVGAVFVILASALAFVTPLVAHWIGGPLGTAILWLRMPVAAVVVMLALALAYYVLPDVEQRFKFITPGAVVAVLLWVLASLGFSAYAKHFGTYEVSYGALGGVIVLLLWMWISSLALLVGAEVNAVLEHLSPEGKRTGARSMDDAGRDAPKAAKAETKVPAPRPEPAPAR
jgi:membrane protein